MRNLLFLVSLLVFSALFLQGATAAQALYCLAPGDTTPLGYSQSRTVGGSGTAAPTAGDGVTFSGTGQVIVKLDDLGSQIISLNGTVPAGGKLRLVEQLDTYDLMTMPYDSTYGFRVKNGTGSVYSSAFSGYCGVSCGHGQVIYGTYYMSVLGLPVNVSSLSNFAAIKSSGTVLVSYGGASPMALSGTQNTNSYTINSITDDQSWYYYTTKAPTQPEPPLLNNGDTVYLYDRSPATDLLTMTQAADHVSSTTPTVPGRQYYLIAEPSGGTITVTGSANVVSDGSVSHAKTLQFFGKANSKSGAPLPDGSVSFTVKNATHVAWGPFSFDGLVDSGFFQHVVGSASQLVTILGNSYNLTVEISDQPTFTCAGTAVCEKFNVSFVG